MVKIENLHSTLIKYKDIGINGFSDNFKEIYIPLWLNIKLAITYSINIIKEEIYIPLWLNIKQKYRVQF